MYTMKPHDETLTETEILQEILILEMEMARASEY